MTDQLRHDGDTAEIDGRTYRLRIEPDYEGSINDFDCYGRASDARDYVHDGHSERPSGFDGNAEKIQIDRGYWVWWQPPVDVPRGTDAFREVRSMARDVLELGFSGYVLERLDGTDAYGRPIVADVASLWGIEPYIDDSYAGEIVADLLAEFR